MASETNHPWCRDVSRDEAIRRTEDAAAVPAIQHRDLPEAVAALTERVAELTTKHNALADLARLDAGWLKANEQRLTAERDEARARVAELEAAEKQAASTEAMRCITKMRRERDAAIRERDEARAECKMLLAERDEATGRCKMMLARVAELESAAANAGGKQEPVAWMYKGDAWFDGKIWHDRYETTKDEKVAKWKDKDAVPLYAAPQPPRGWLTAEEREGVEECVSSIRQEISLLELWQPDHRWLDQLRQKDAVLSGLLARSTPPKVKVPKAYVEAVEVYRDMVIAAIRAAGGEVEE